MELVDTATGKVEEATGELMEEVTTVELVEKVPVKLLEDILLEVVKEGLMGMVDVLERLEEVLMITVEEEVAEVLVEAEAGLWMVEVPVVVGVGVRDDDNEENCSDCVNDWMGVAELGVAASECNEKQ